MDDVAFRLGESYGTILIDLERRVVVDLLPYRAAGVAPKNAGVCRGLLPVEVALCTFTRHDGLEPTNNAAERAIRHAVCLRKTSYGTDFEPYSRKPYWFG